MIKVLLRDDGSSAETIIQDGHIVIRAFRPCGCAFASERIDGKLVNLMGRSCTEHDDGTIPEGAEGISTS